MIRLLSITSEGVTQGGEELLDVRSGRGDGWLWVDFCDEPAERERACLCDRLGFDEQDVEDAQRRRHPPQLHVHGEQFFLLLKPLRADSRSMDFSTQQLAVFAADRLLVTRRSAASPFIDERWARIAAGEEHPADPLVLVAAITGRLAERYGGVLLDLERRLDDIEDVLFESRGDALMQELVGYNTALRKMRRILAYHVEVYARLRRHIGATRPELDEEFLDLVEVIERFSSLATLYQDVISDLIDGFISLNGHHLNQIMKVLTVVTVVFVPLSLLVGVYGMNFENMPELKSRYGYYVLISVMAGIAGGLLLWFRRMRWL